MKNSDNYTIRDIIYGVCNYFNLGLYTETRF